MGPEEKRDPALDAGLRFPADLLLEDFGEEGALAFRLSDRVPKLLNRSAALVLHALMEGASPGEASSRLEAEFGIDPGRAREDLEALLEGLEGEGILGRGRVPEGIPVLPGSWSVKLEETMAENEPVKEPEALGPSIPEEAVPFFTEADVILREEDEGAFLFEPESGELSCLNPVGILVWKALDGKTALGAIVDRVATQYEDVDRNTVLGDVRAFLADLKSFGYAGWE